MTKKINGYVKWIGIGIIVGTIIWNAFELHYNTKKNTALLQNDMVHLTSDVTELKQDFKSFRTLINDYLLERARQ